jgi:hypothetical protein
MPWPGSDPIQVAVDVDLEQHARVVSRPPSDRRRRPREPQRTKVQFLDESLDHPYRVVVSDVVIQAFGQQRHLLAVTTLHVSAQWRLRHELPKSTRPKRFHTASAMNSRCRTPGCPPDVSIEGTGPSGRQPGHRLDLDLQPEVKRSRGDDSACRTGASGPGRIQRVERRPVLNRIHVNADLDEVVS